LSFTLELFSSALPAGLTVSPEFGVDERQSVSEFCVSPGGGGAFDEESTNLPNQASQAAGFVRLIRRSRFVCRLRGGRSFRGISRAWFVSLDRTVHSRSLIFLLAPVPPSFRKAHGVETEETKPSRKEPGSFQFVFLRFPFLAVGKNLKTKALTASAPFLPASSSVIPALKSPQPPLPLLMRFLPF
jgi:hypothetical protein